MKKWPPWAIALVVTVSVHAVIVGWLVWRDAPPPIAPVTVVLKDAKALTRVSVLQRSPKAEPPSPPGERVGVRVKAVAEPTVVVARPFWRL